MLISIILATRNRADYLAQVISSVCTPENLSFHDWEIIVADNGSSDRTHQVCQELKILFPSHFYCVEEKRPGKSNAINTALRMARGEFIALIDDDVICQNDYLQCIRMVVGNGFTDVAQGRIFVDYHSERPVWFDEDEDFDRMMLLCDMGEEPVELSRSLWGANVLIPMAALAKVGGYCPELGAGANGFGEDAELGNRLRSFGYRLIYMPQIVVRHQVCEERLNARYVLKRSFDIGRCEAYYLPIFATPVWRYGAYAIKEIVFSLPSFFWSLAWGRKGKAIRQGCEQLERIGLVTQLWRFRKPGPPKLTIPQICLENSRQKIKNDGTDHLAEMHL